MSAGDVGGGGADRFREADPRVVGAEVVAPFADAVRLVDGEQRRLHTRNHLHESAAPKALGRDIDQVVPAAFDLVDELFEGRAPRFRSGSTSR